MFRNTAIRAHSLFKTAVNLNQPQVVRNIGSTSRLFSKHNTETDDQFDARYENFFNRKDIDGWEIRQGINDLCGHDLVPEPKIIAAALKACRRVNDFALAVRILEAVKDKCGGKVNEIYPYVIQEIRPVLSELGINTPEELGFDKPELALESVYQQ